MSHPVKYPLVYEINTRVWLKELSEKFSTPISLSNIPISEVQKWADYNINAIWLMGIWNVGPSGEKIARAHKGLWKDYAKANPEWKPEDILSSPYAIQDYKLNPHIGNHQSLQKFRNQLLEYDIQLILDFVPNHTALDHKWVKTHPEYYVQVPEEVYNQVPENYYKTDTNCYLAHGRDPFFPPWTDTLQLNYGNPDLQKAMIAELKSIAKMCNGVRCDMAMLMLKDIYNQVWGNSTGEMSHEFWERAITEVKKEFPDFLFIAEAYWDKEWDLQQLGYKYP
jgi:glycosidase